MERHDGWFLVAMGIGFVAFAWQYGRALGQGLEGRRTAEQRAADVRRNVYVAIVFGMGLILSGGYLLLRQ
jgi:hypothetical protein